MAFLVSCFFFFSLFLFHAAIIFIFVLFAFKSETTFIFRWSIFVSFMVSNQRVLRFVDIIIFSYLVVLRFLSEKKKNKLNRNIVA